MIARSQGGLGLGLALVKGLVELHGGTVTVASDGADRGSVFRVHLPTLPTIAPTKDERARTGCGDTVAVTGVREGTAGTPVQATRR